MNKFFKSVITTTTSSLLFFSLIPLSGSAAIGDVDPNGDGYVNMSDSVYILQYLAGEFEPTDLNALDFDENGIISYIDALKVQYYDAGLL
jgi:hypothetical protein